MTAKKSGSPTAGHRTGQAGPAFEPEYQGCPQAPIPIIARYGESQSDQGLTKFWENIDRKNFRLRNRLGISSQFRTDSEYPAAIRKEVWPKPGRNFGPFPGHFFGKAPENSASKMHTGAARGPAVCMCDALADHHRPQGPS